MATPLDRLIRGALVRRREAGVCPDAETLAAFADGGLSPAERREVERHAADCVACGRQLALVVEMAEAEAPAARASWLPGWRWLVPLATAVLVVAVWTRLPETPLPSAERVSEVAAKPEEPRADAAAPVDAPALAAESAQSAPAQEAPVPRPPRAVGALKAPQAKAESQEQRQAFDDLRAAPEALREGAAAPAAPPAPAEPRLRAADEEAKEKPETFAGRRPQVTVEADAAAPSRAEAGASLMRKSASGPLVVAAPGDVRVRVAGDRVERSADGGRTWVREADAPAAPIVAGVCPSADACWLAGDGGTILRRDSSGAWARRDLPVPQHVAAIVAADAMQATATLADGRRFSTSDGGRTWKP